MVQEVHWMSGESIHRKHIHIGWGSRRQGGGSSSQSLQPRTPLRCRPEVSHTSEDHTSITVPSSNSAAARIVSAEGQRDHAYAESEG
eukprot:23370-Eustigmatos_ZCMA.PRE.1